MEKNFAKYYKITDKEFWRNYWFYYRVHTIIGAIALVLIISTIVSVVTRVEPDIGMLHIGGGIFSESQVAQMEGTLAEKTPDLNADGNQVVSFQSLLYNEQADAEMAYASMTKADMEFIGGESTLVLVDETTMQRYIDMEVLADVTEYVQRAGIAPERLRYSEEGGYPLLVNVMDTDLVREIGYQGPDLYLGLRVLPNKMQKDENMMQRVAASEQLFAQWIATVR